MRDTGSHPIFLYDGVCALCNRGVQFFLKRDRHDRLRFASLQSDFAVDLLKRHGIDARDLNTLYVVRNQGRANEKVLARSDAILDLMREIGGIWKVLSYAGKIIPGPVRDWSYGLVARNRYRLFGKYESCMLPDPRHAHKFLDQKAVSGK
jgi:predicted DCC family thiol-disulfide oxidoreductase YuxK